MSGVCVERLLRTAPGLVSSELKERIARGEEVPKWVSAMEAYNGKGVALSCIPFGITTYRLLKWMNGSGTKTADSEKKQERKTVRPRGAVGQLPPVRLFFGEEEDSVFGRRFKEGLLGEENGEEVDKMAAALRKSFLGERGGDRFKTGWWEEENDGPFAGRFSLNLGGDEEAGLPPLRLDLFPDKEREVAHLVFPEELAGDPRVENLPRAALALELVRTQSAQAVDGKIAPEVEVGEDGMIERVAVEWTREKDGTPMETEAVFAKDEEGGMEVMVTNRRQDDRPGGDCRGDVEEFVKVLRRIGSKEVVSRSLGQPARVQERVPVLVPRRRVEEVVYEREREKVPVVVRP